MHAIPYTKRSTKKGLIHLKNTILYKKLCKKKQRELDKARRGTWGIINPVTRRPENPKAYNRRKAQRWERDPSAEPFLHRVV